MRRGEWAAWLGERVRVYDGTKDHVRVEGEVVGVITAPCLVIQAADGTRHYESSDLPIEVMEWRQL